MDENASRNFVHGKLGSAIKTLNGLCEYYVETTFVDGCRRCIDMFTGSLGSIDLRTNKGFAHRLRFKLQEISK